VQTFASCPLHYFFAYLLGIDPGIDEDDSFHMAADARGTFVHEVLETYLQLRIGEGHPQGEQSLGQAHAAVVEKWKREDPGTTGRVWEIETAEILRKLRPWIARERDLESHGFAPVAAELSFGSGSRNTQGNSGHPVEFTLADGKVLSFAGKIDRVDANAGGRYLVLDYKSGGSKSYSAVNKDPVDRGRHLQLPIYSHAIRQLNSSDVPAAAGFWFVLDGKQEIIPAPDEFDADHADERLQEVLETLNATNDQGHFVPNPGKDRFPSFENCGFCPFDSVCPTGSRRRSMLRTHLKEPRLARYFRLAAPDEGVEG